MRVSSLLPLLAIGLACEATPVRAQGDEANHAIDVLGYRIAVELSAEASAYSAMTEINFEVVEDDIEVARFDFVGLTVDSVRVNDSAARAWARRRGRRTDQRCGLVSRRARRRPHLQAQPGGTAHRLRRQLAGPRPLLVSRHRPSR
jgi:hypothetical protein